MTDAILRELAAATLAATLGVLLIASLRRSLRRYAGPQAAYLLWLLVPVATLAVFLPGAPVSHQSATLVPVVQVVSHYLGTLSYGSRAGSHWSWIVELWLAGVAITAGLNVVRQMRLAGRLNSAQSDEDGVFYSEVVSGPLLTGIWRQRIVVPMDFLQRYIPEERALMIAHERAHQSRGDVYAIALATVWLCLFWFNPIMYWARGRLRFDQELACDAHVVAAHPSTRKLYTKVLLAAQSTDFSLWFAPSGCHWTSAHPLKERIAMLKQVRPGVGKRLTGMAAAIALSMLSAVGVMTFSSTSVAQVASVSGAWLHQPISISVTDKSVAAAFQEVARITNHNIVVTPALRGSNLEQKVSLYFTDLEVGKCLEVLAHTIGATYRESNGVVYIDKQG